MGMFESNKKLPGSETLSIHFQGDFDLQKLTDAMKKYLDNKGYLINFKDQTEAPLPEGKDTIYEWKCERQPIPYIKFYIDVLIWTYHMNDVVIEENGTKKKIQTGDLHIQIQGEMEKNWDNSFPNTTMGEFLRKLYEKYVAYNRLIGYWGKIFTEIVELSEVAKSSIGLSTRG
jgi:hypothetical protein